MPYILNGQLVTEDRIRAEEVRIRQDPQFLNIPDEVERTKRVRTTAEWSAIDIMLVEQIAARDPRPIDPAEIAREMQMQRATGNSRNGYDDRQLRQWIEWNLRLQRIAREMIAGARRPTAEDIEAFYQVNRHNFRGCALFEASHIVKHIDAQQSEAQARVEIEAALLELQSGVEFAAVADSYSDCKGKGGDLGEFLAGTMVQEFEDAIRNLQPGERTDIFRTPFGFHIAQLRRKVPAGQLDFEEVREDIRHILTRMQEHKEYLRVVGELRSRSEVRWIAAETTKLHDEPDAMAS